MTSDRFFECVAAYGADVARWPVSERDPARALIAEGVPEVRAALAAAARLDGWLNADSVPAADRTLQNRIIDSAAAVGLTGNAPKRSWREWRWLWPSAGLASIGLAGSLAGAFAVSIALGNAAPAAQSDWPERATAFSAGPAEWSEE